MSIMSISEARKILGKEADLLTDSEVEDLVSKLEAIAKLTIQSLIKGEMKLSER